MVDAIGPETDFTLETNRKESLLNFQKKDHLQINEISLGLIDINFGVFDDEHKHFFRTVTYCYLS